MISLKDAHLAKEENLRKLLSFALERDASGPRLKETPPKDKTEVINQLLWLGVVSSGMTGGWG